MPRGRFLGQLPATRAISYGTASAPLYVFLAFSLTQSRLSSFATLQLKQGQITGNSYVPNGLTAAQYAAIRAKDQQKKEENYKRNVNKAFKFLGYDEFYKSRGTDLSGTWKKDVNLGHRMAKTKFDWSGKKNEVKGFESFGSSIFGGKKK